MMNHNKLYGNILLVGGAVRNVGKTSLICKIIEKFSKENRIYALKIKTIYEGDGFFHGKDSHPLSGNYTVSEHTKQSDDTDTQRMFAAGAERIFYIKTKSEFLETAFFELFNKQSKDVLWICESVSLREIIQPSVFLLILKSENKTDLKPSAERMLSFADQIIETDGITHNFDLNRISVSNAIWEKT